MDTLFYHTGAAFYVVCGLVAAFYVVAVLPVQLAFLFFDWAKRYYPFLYIAQKHTARQFWIYCRKKRID